MQQPQQYHQANRILISVADHGVLAALDQLNSYYELGDGGQARDWSSPRFRAPVHDPRAAGDVELGVLDGTHLLDERAGDAGDERVRLRGRRGGEGDAAGA